MKRVLITGSSGRIGRALHWKLSQKYETKGIDLSPASATSIIGDICDHDLLLKSFDQVDTVFHVAALHAPHVHVQSDDLFYKINVAATENICKAALVTGVSQIIFTSTTALYGYANYGKEQAAWIDEGTTPLPKTIYHKTKLAAEKILKEYAGNNLSVRVMRMSRCFPEPVQQMAVYRLHRGIDYRDAADAHVRAAEVQYDKDYDIFIISGHTPFAKSDGNALVNNPEAIIRKRHPQLADAFDKRKWSFPTSIDRVYDSSYVKKILGWQSKKGALDVIRQFDNEDFEILPPDIY